MANPSLNRANSGAETAVLVSKMLFLAIGIASTVFFFSKFAYLLSDSLPALQKSIAAGFVPRYLFIVVNSIIIVVWKLHRVQHHDDDHEEDSKMYRTSSDSSLLPPKLDLDPSSLNDPNSLLRVDIPAKPSELSDVAIGNEQSSDPWPPPDTPPDYLASMENDSMDATWKAITGGGSSPNKNQNILTKSDTWERTTDVISSPQLARSSAAAVRRFGKSDTFRESAKSSPEKEMRKSVTFRETSSSPVAAMGWRGRDRLVIGQDELFSKVEAFIRMNYEQMRRQHQESDHRYEMVNAAY